MWIEGQEDVFSFSINNPRILTLPFQIDPVDDKTNFEIGPIGEILNITPSSKLVLKLILLLYYLKSLAYRATLKDFRCRHQINRRMD